MRALRSAPISCRPKEMKAEPDARSAVLRDLRVALVADRVRAADVDGVSVGVGERQNLVARGGGRGDADLDEDQPALLVGGVALLEGPGAGYRAAADLAGDVVPVDLVEAEAAV